MKSSLTLSLLNLFGGTLAGVIKLERRWGWQCPAGTCPFTISVNGGPVYENPTDAHQLAFGGSSPGAAVEFCISSAGQITDEDGICGITVPIPGDMETTQFQCDAGMTSVFTIDCNGDIEYEGSPNFYACEASASIGYNIYATPPELSQCASGTPLEIQLVASACYQSCSGEWSGWKGWSGWSGWQPPK